MCRSDYHLNAQQGCANGERWSVEGERDRFQGGRTAAARPARPEPHRVRAGGAAAVRAGVRRLRLRTRHVGQRDRHQLRARGRTLPGHPRHRLADAGWRPARLPGSLRDGMPGNRQQPERARSQQRAGRCLAAAPGRQPGAQRSDHDGALLRVEQRPRGESPAQRHAHLLQRCDEREQQHLHPAVRRLGAVRGAVPLLAGHPGDQQPDPHRAARPGDHHGAGVRSLPIPRRGERGQAAVIIALGGITLLALVGLAIDGGMAAGAYRHAQNAADAGALAAARQELLNALASPSQPSNSTTLTPVAQTEVAHNHAALLDTTSGPTADAGWGTMQTVDGMGLSYSLAASLLGSLFTSSQTTYVPNTASGLQATGALADVWTTAGTLL